MDQNKKLAAIKKIQETTKKFGFGIPQEEIIFLDTLVEKMENGTPLDTKEQSYVDRNIKSIYG